MSKNDENFKWLQRYWYKRLAVNGFRDIETQKGELLENCNKRLSRMDDIDRRLKEEYFRFIGQIVNDPETYFRNDIDRHILTRYAEGARIKTIVAELLDMETPRERKSVRIIIRRYEQAWKIRSYNRKELNLKP